MKVTQKVHGELTAARKAKRATKAAEAATTTTGDTSVESTPEVADSVGQALSEGKARGRGRKKVLAAVPAPGSTATPDDGGELVVFAFRLSRAERDAIHAAAGSAKASRFVRGLAIAAARGDVDGIEAILAEAKARRDA